MKRLTLLLLLLCSTANADWFINEGQQSVIRNVVLYQSADPDAVITTVTSETSGLAAVICPNEGTSCFVYDAAAEFEDIATFGTYAAPSASNLRIEHISSGVYQIQFLDAVFAAGSQATFLISGAGVYPMSIEIMMDGVSQDDIGDEMDTRMAAYGGSGLVDTDDFNARTTTDPATNTDQATIISGIDGLGTSIATVGDDVGAVKDKTDQLTFTVPGEVDANIESQNGIEVCGDGSLADQWRSILLNGTC